MQTVTINIYDFSELSEQAKKKVLADFQYINVQYEWWDSVYEDAANIGLKITSFDTDRGNECCGEFTLSANEVAQNILNNHGESCDTYTAAKLFFERWQPVFNNYMDPGHVSYESTTVSEVLMTIEDMFLTELLTCYLNMLKKDLEYRYSEEAITETIEAKDYKFTEDGRQYY